MRGPSRLDDSWEETDPLYAAKNAHGQIILDRLSKLLHAGYRIDLRYVHEGLGVPLRHPNKKMPALELHGDGLINDQSPSHFRDRPDHERTLFEPEDSHGFDRFVAGIAKPTWLQQVAIRSVGETLELRAGLLLLIGLVWGTGKLVEWIWLSVRASF